MLNWSFQSWFVKVTQQRVTGYIVFHRKPRDFFEQTWHLHKSFYWHFLRFIFYFDLGEWSKGKVGFCFSPHWPRNAIQTHHFYYVYVYKYICVLIFSVRHAQWADCACGERKISLGLDLAVSTSCLYFRSHSPVFPELW